MNEDVIVVMGATHRAGMMDEYEKQLQKAGVPYSIEPLQPLPLGANSINMQVRINYWRGVVNKFSNYDYIYITDAWDVLFFGTRQELIDKAPQTMIISGERNCYPEGHLSDRAECQSPWKYANNGMMVANRIYLSAWLDRAQEAGDLGILDQAWFNRKLLIEKSSLVLLDYYTSLFYVVSSNLEDGTLQVNKNRPWNSRYDTYPCFLHFSGGTSPIGIKQMLYEAAL